MAALAILAEKQIEASGKRQYVVHTVRHDGGSNTVSVDQSASAVAVFPLDGQSAPTATVGSADSNNQKDVTLSGGGSGQVDVWTYHSTAVASSKP
jgi:hypothetical protein